ncbi:unnamed protein product, partial [Laminaria digitata]
LSTAGDGFGGGGSGSTLSSVSAFGCHGGDGFLPEQSYSGGAMLSQEEEEAAVAAVEAAAPAAAPYFVGGDEILCAATTASGSGNDAGRQQQSLTPPPLRPSHHLPSVIGPRSPTTHQHQNHYPIPLETALSYSMALMPPKGQQQASPSRDDNGGGGGGGRGGGNGGRGEVSSNFPPVTCVPGMDPCSPRGVGEQRRRQAGVSVAWDGVSRRERVGV